MWHALELVSICGGTLGSPAPMPRVAPHYGHNTPLVSNGVGLHIHTEIVPSIQSLHKDAKNLLETVTSTAQRSTSQHSAAQHSTGHKILSRWTSRPTFYRLPNAPKIVLQLFHDFLGACVLLGALEEGWHQPILGFVQPRHVGRRATPVLRQLQGSSASWR